MLAVNIALPHSQMQEVAVSSLAFALFLGLPFIPGAFRLLYLFTATKALPAFLSCCHIDVRKLLCIIVYFGLLMECGVDHDPNLTASDWIILDHPDQYMFNYPG